MRYTAIVESPLGEVRLASDGRALTGLWFVGQRYDGAGLGTDAQVAPDLPVFAEARGWLDAYLEGGRQVRPPAVALGGTPFQREVWGALRRIPYGATATYGDIARDLGRPAACRAVGAAVGRNPVSLIVPCHRAVGSGGSLTGYAGGLWRKRTLLALESDGIMTGEVADRAPGLVGALTDLWERSVRAPTGFCPTARSSACGPTSPGPSAPRRGCSSPGARASRWASWASTAPCSTCSSSIPGSAGAASAACCWSGASRTRA